MEVNQIIKLTDKVKEITQEVNQRYKINLPEKLVKNIIDQFQENLKISLIRLNKQPANNIGIPFKKKSEKIKYHLSLPIDISGNIRHNGIMIKIISNRTT